MQEITFLNWDQPLLTKLVKHLRALKDDVVNKIVIVPTVQSGRQLRKALAEAGINLTPRVVTPDILLPTRDPGTRAAALTAWTQVLLELDLDDARGLFPKDPPPGVIHSFRWAFNVAKQLSELQQTLRDNGKTFQEISRRSIESQRWADLATLDDRVTKTLRKWRIQPNDQLPLEPIPSDKQLIIAGVPDISPLAIARLENLLENNTPIEIIIHAPETHRPHFDPWGRPLSDYWNTAELPLPNWQQNVTIAENPTLAAKHIVTQIAKQDLIPVQLTLGLCDRDLVLAMQREFATAGWDIYDPEGASIRSSSLILFLTALGEWLTTNPATPALTNPISALAKLIRLPEIEAFLPEKTDRYTLIRQLDLCTEKRLPLHASDLNNHLQNSTTQEYPQLTKTLQHLLTETQKMLSGNKIKGLQGWIARLLNRTHPDIAALLVDDIAHILQALTSIEKHSGKDGLEITQALEIITEIISNKKSYQNTTNTVADLHSWMELIYQDSPELFLIGLHEGHIPESHGDDPFLPDSFRQMLGMDSGDIHYARDSYLFHALIASRQNTHITLSKLSETNEPKTPSRLLLRTTGKDLAERVHTFFGDPQFQSSNPSAWQRDWTLNIPQVPNPYSPENDPIQALSPSALKDYLHCPFRFFLNRIVRMRRYDANKTELNALDFGNLIHATVENFGKDPAIRDSTSAKEIQNHLDLLLEQEIFIRYGANPHLAIRIQADIAKSRLHKLATLQAQEATDGWRIIDVELDIGNKIHWDINGHPIKMQIDRVDRHIHTGEIRVMDYKSSGKASDPLKAHITNFNPDQNRPICGDLLPKAPRGRTERTWQNLQLPIYAWFAQQHYKTTDIPTIGYINLPNTLSDTAFTTWKKFDSTLLDSAKQWTTQAIKNIQQSDFLHPATLPTNQENWDDYSKLAQGNITQAFALNT
ncbi:MAG: PD-(D/E)XK nuclease family protein [Akkermansiaceae bacterium]